MTKKPKRIIRAVKPPPLNPVQTVLAVIGDQFAQNPEDHKRKRFMIALALALPKLSPDDMDRIEPVLVNLIGRTYLATQIERLGGV